MTSKGTVMADLGVTLLTLLVTCCVTTQTKADVIPPCQIKRTNYNNLAMADLLVGQHDSHYEMYSVTNSAHNSSTCVLSVEDLLCKVGCNSTASGITVHYQRLSCDGDSPFQIVFNHSQGLHLDRISYLELVGCEVSLLNVGVYGEATDLKCVTFGKCTFLDYPSSNAAVHLNVSDTFLPQIYPDIIRGLENIVALTFNAEGAGGTLIPTELFMYKWSSMADLDLQLMIITKQQLDILNQTLPNLQSLKVMTSNLSALPVFPWSSLLRPMPNNLTRTDTFNSHYAEGEGLTLDPRLTRRIISIIGNNLHDLSSYQFRGRLDKIELTSNQIHALGQDTFDKVSHLQSLILKSNRIRRLPTGVFRNLHSLTELDLSSNAIDQISEKDFQGLQQLKTLNIANNSLISIPAKTFSPLRMLVTLDLSHNSMLKFASESFGNNMPNTFASVNLDSNNMTNFPAWIFTTRSLRKIYLSRNRISFDAIVKSLEGQKSNIIISRNMESASRLSQPYKSLYYKMIDLTYNNITTLDYNKVRSIGKKGEWYTILNYFTLDLKGNDIHCDCDTYSMYSFLNRVRKTALSNSYKIPRVRRFHYDEWKCSKPDDVHGKLIMELANDTFVCKKELEGCPERCICFERAVDRSVIVNCSGRQLEILPQQVPNLTDTLLLSHNVMVNLTSISYLQSLKTLDVSHNLIRTIADDAVSSLDHIDSVKLHGNKMDRMPLGFKSLQHVQLTLSNNFFICDCHMKWARQWTFDYRMNIKDINNVDCSSGVPRSKAMYGAKEADFICEISREALTGIAIGVPILLLLVIVGLVLFYVFRGEIKVLLYYHFNWHPFDRNHTDVVDKLYDAFVSYNKAETHYVLKTLQPTLESDKHPFRLCMETRDFRPGGLITDNILYSVKYSRRSIMLLTKNYLKNEWCRYEFKSAHHKVLKDRSNYLIVILFDGLDLEDLDEEMKLYLKTNTYIKYDSKLFWKRILYAMPEKPLSVLREESFPSNGYETLFPSPESLTIMQIIRHRRSLAMHPDAENNSFVEYGDMVVDDEKRTTNEQISEV